MNANQTINKWNKMKKRAEKIWGELTEEDLKKAKGSVDILYRIIQEKYGNSKEEVEKKLNEVLK